MAGREQLTRLLSLLMGEAGLLPRRVCLGRLTLADGPQPRRTSPFDNRVTDGAPVPSQEGNDAVTGAVTLRHG
jgi:hypothetical protein